MQLGFRFVTMIVTHIRGLIATLKTTPEPPSESGASSSPEFPKALLKLLGLQVLLSSSTTGPQKVLTF